MNPLNIFLGAAALGVTTLSLPAAAQTQPPRAGNDLSQICAGGECGWEVYATCEGFIEGINFDSDGTMWMVGYLEGRVMRGEDGACITVGEQQGFPNGSRFAPDGRLLIADRTGGIQVVDTETGEREPLYTQFVTAQFRGLNDLTFDPEGGLYFTEPYGSNALDRVGRVYYVSPEEGAVPELFADNMAFPNGIAVSADGLRVYIAEYGQNRIISVPSRLNENIFETPFVFANLTGGIGPDGLTVDAAGNLYAAQFGAGQVAVFDWMGMPYGVIPLPEGAAHFTTNLALHDGYLYLTEAIQNIVWRLAVSTEPLPH